MPKKAKSVIGVKDVGKKNMTKEASSTGHAGDPEVDDQVSCKVCLMCSEIVETSKDAEGQDAIFCDRMPSLVPLLVHGSDEEKIQDTREFRGPNFLHDLCREPQKL